MLYRKPINIIILTGILACFSFAPIDCLAQNQDLTKVENIFGVKLGLIGSGKFDGSFPISFYYGDVETEKSWTIGIFADQALNSSMSLGFYLDVHDLKTDSVSEKMIDIGMALKGSVIRKKSKVSIRPGLALGYGYLNEFAGRDRLHFLNIKGFTEVYYALTPKVKILSDISLFGSPIGGYRNGTINFGPMILIRSGISF